ncbi:MAG: hypothetical protein ACRDIA_00445 [Actinomycetota bacterium]
MVMVAEELMISPDAARDMVVDLTEISKLIGRPFGLPEVLAAASGAFDLLKDEAEAEAQSQ